MTSTTRILSFILITAILAACTPAPTALPTATPTPATPIFTPTIKPTNKPTATSNPGILPSCSRIGQEWTSPVDGMTLVCVPGGEFLMGSTDADGEAYDDEKPQHTVYLDAYWIDQTEVSNAQYARCVATGACREPDSEGSYTRDNYYGNSQYADYPVIRVSWDDAADYCTWAGRELPSEAQWEKAARGTEGGMYPWGNEDVAGNLLNFADSNTTSLVWFDKTVDDGYGDTASVGSYPDGASPYGALDMAGNVWEWTADWYDIYSSQTTWRNPAEPSSGGWRVLRGGAWSSGSRGVRAANRSGGTPDERNSDRGFRCLLSP